MQNTTIKYVYQNGQLVPAGKTDTLKLDFFSKTLKEGDEVDVYLSIIATADKTPAQLAKVHACVRDLATFTGHEFHEVKIMIKDKAGIYSMSDTGKKEYKSFGDCNKEELSAAIQGCMEIANNIGCYLN